jgi:hypothetical protein
VAAAATEMRVESLDAKKHDRASFSSGVENLDAYLKTQASQDVRRKANAVLPEPALTRQATSGRRSRCSRDVLNPTSA